MRWADVDLKAARWTIPAAETKVQRRHFVPLSPTAVEILRTLPRLGVYVFTTDGRTHMTNYAKLKSRLDAFVAATGGTGAAWRLHDLRRSASTHMVRLGVPELVVGRVLNHAAKDITARVYALHAYGPEKGTRSIPGQRRSSAPPTHLWDRLCPRRWLLNDVAAAC
jgi:integrase